MWNILVRVRLKSDTVHSKFSTVQAGFSLAWVDQTFVSSLCKLWSVHFGFTLRLYLVSPIVSSLTPPPTCLLFPLALQLSNWRSSPTEDCPQDLNQDINHTRGMQLVPDLLPSHYFPCLNIASYFFPDQELDEGALATEATLLSFLNTALCPFSSPVTSPEYPGWRNTGQWGNPWAGGHVLSLPLPQ